MKAIAWLLAPILLANAARAQQAAADRLVAHGMSYYSNETYALALSDFEQALKLEPDYLPALTEMAYSLLAEQRFEEAIRYCRAAIARHPGAPQLCQVYVTYGNALGELQRTEEALQRYEEGIRRFPAFYELHYSKGLALTRLRRWDEALRCFERAVQLNPEDADSHNSIARILDLQHKRIPALMAYCRYLSLEPTGQVSQENLVRIQRLMQRNVEVTASQQVVVHLRADGMEEPAAGSDGNFAGTDLILSMQTSLDFQPDYQNEQELERFERKIFSVCASLGETRDAHRGFFWDYYAPYFVRLTDRRLLRTFAYKAFASSERPEIRQWLDTHSSELRLFDRWSKSFQW